MRRLTLAFTGLAALASPAAADPDYACKVPDAGTKITVTMRPETSLQDLATWVTSFTCKNVVFSADVAKHATRVTVVSSKPMTPKQAVQLFVDAVESTGLVVVQKPDTFVIKLGKDMPRSCPDVAASSPGVDPFVPPAEAPVDDDLAQSIAAGIREVDPTTRDVDRSLVDKVLANPMAIAKGARVVPAVKDGKPAGFKLYAIRPSSVYAKLGLANGDTVEKVNGYALTSADAALEVYTKLREAKRVELDVVRRGKPVRLVWIIKER